VVLVHCVELIRFRESKVRASLRRFGSSAHYLVSLWEFGKACEHCLHPLYQVAAGDFSGGEIVRYWRGSVRVSGLRSGRAKMHARFTFCRSFPG